MGSVWLIFVILIYSKLIDGDVTTNSINSTNTTSVVVDRTHMGRENVIPSSKIVSEPSAINFVMPEKNDGKKSVPKKSAPAERSSSSSSTTPTLLGIIVTNTTKPRPKKPLILEVDHDLPASSEKDSKKSEIPSADLDQSQEKQRRRADYIVPIVAVILSVPLVAIIISVLYKRTSEWWQHRHYRRMDFLIEGMYNT